jgi:hypothetical protein
VLHVDPAGADSDRPGEERMVVEPGDSRHDTEHIEDSVKGADFVEMHVLH